MQFTRRHLLIDKRGPAQRFLNIGRNEDELVNPLRHAGAVVESEADLFGYARSRQPCSKARKVSV